MAKDTIQIVQKPDYGEMVFITGMTGSGKSKLARYLLGVGGYPRVIVQDGKHEFEAPKEWGKEGEGYAFSYDDEGNDIPDLFHKFKKVIWRPDVSILEEQQNWWILENLYDWIYKTGNMVFYDDEASMSSTSSKYPIAKKRLLKQGRSKGISTWNVTQSPVGVPNDFMRESSHAFIYYLNAESDRQKLAGNYGNRLLKMNDASEDFQPFQFYYYSVKNRGVLKKYNPIPI